MIYLIPGNGFGFIILEGKYEGKSLMLEEKQVHHGSPGTANHCLRHGLLTQKTLKTRKQCSKTGQCSLWVGARQRLCVMFSQSKDGFSCFFMMHEPHWFWAWEGTLDTGCLCEIRQEKIMWTRGSLRYYNVISEQQSWRTLSYFRIRQK